MTLVSKMKQMDDPLKIIFFFLFFQLFKHESNFNKQMSLVYQMKQMDVCCQNDPCVKP